VWLGAAGEVVGHRLGRRVPLPVEREWIGRPQVAHATLIGIPRRLSPGRRSVLPCRLTSISVRPTIRHAIGHASRVFISSNTEPRSRADSAVSHLDDPRLHHKTTSGSHAQVQSAGHQGNLERSCPAPDIQLAVKANQRETPASRRQRVQPVLQRAVSVSLAAAQYESLSITPLTTNDRAAMRLPRGGPGAASGGNRKRNDVFGLSIGVQHAATRLIPAQSCAYGGYRRGT